LSLFERTALVRPSRNALVHGVGYLNLSSYQRNIQYDERLWRHPWLTVGGLHELEFRQVIRIYLAEIDGQIVLLLGGSGKRNQDREIVKARARLKDFEQRTK